MTRTTQQVETLLNDPATPASRLSPLVGHSVKTDRVLAIHPQASEAILSRLAESADRPTRRGVAKNPQTPKNVLLKLAPTFAGEFFLNPAFDLLLLEDPNLLDALPVTVIKNILKRPDCPSSLLRWAAAYGGRSHQLAVVDREVIGRPLLEQISSGPHGQAAEKAAGRLLRGDYAADEHP
jgi:hypothetical protein